MQCFMGRQHVCKFLFIIHLCHFRKIKLCVMKMVLIWVAGGKSGVILVLQGVLSALSFRVKSVVEGAASEHSGCKFPNSLRS